MIRRFLQNSTQLFAYFFHVFFDGRNVLFLYRKHTDRVMQTVRAANTKRFPKAIKAGTRPANVAKSGHAKGAESKPFDFSFATKPPEEQERPVPSMDDLRAAVRRLSVSENGKLLVEKIWYFDDQPYISI